MNKSPPTSGGLFYFGQIAIFKDKPGVRSCNMQKVMDFVEAWDRESGKNVSLPAHETTSNLRYTIKKGRLAQAIQKDGKKRLFNCQNGGCPRGR